MSEYPAGPAAEEDRLDQAEHFIMNALAGDPGGLPHGDLLRAHRELLRHSRLLLGIVLGDLQLADRDLRVRPEAGRAPLVAALHAELPASAGDWDRAVAAGLAVFADSTAEVVTRWLRQARAEAARDGGGS